jgi:hypothetical protein
MSMLLEITLWLLLGAAVGGAHLLLLSQSVGRASALPPLKARAAILRGLPLRLLLWAPVLVLAARSGALACGSFLVGSWLARLAAVWLGRPSSRATPASGD